MGHFEKGAWVDEIEFPGEGGLRIDGIPAGTISDIKLVFPVRAQVELIGNSE